MNKTTFVSCIFVLLSLVSFAQIIPSTGRVQDVKTAFSFRMLDDQHNRIMMQTGWTSQVGDYLFLKHPGNNTEEGTYGIRIGDGIGFEFGKNDFGTTFFNVNKNGNVGIGTKTPNGKLDIYGANFNTTNLILSANYVDKYRWRLKTRDRGNAIDMDFTASDANDSEETVLKLTRSTSGRPEFQLYNDAIVANNGNVGIGTASPKEKLQVEGTIKSQKLLLLDPNNTDNWNNVWESGFYQSYNATNAPEPNQWFWGINMNHSSNNSEYKYNGQIVIKNNSLYPRMYFRSTKVDGTGIWTRVLHSEGVQHINGSLGIGTTNPNGWKLAVNGKIRAKEVKVEANWADYVFEDNYDLPTLQEVETHIKEKGHLQNIPSAQEVAENGIELGEMNKLLLEKIEELTLYTIQQEKEIKELRSLVEKLVENRK